MWDYAMLTKAAKTVGGPAGLEFIVPAPDVQDLTLLGVCISGGGRIAAACCSAGGSSGRGTVSTAACQKAEAHCACHRSAEDFVLSHVYFLLQILTP